MKKIFVTTVILSLLSIDTYSQTQEKTPVAVDILAEYSVATNPFSQNWEIALGLQGLAFYSNQESTLSLSKSPFKAFRTQPGLAFSATKWFSPEIGLRTKLSGWWGRSVSTDDKDLNSIRYMHLHEDVMINLSNIIGDYKAERPWNIIPYGGIGMARNFTHNENALTLSLGLATTYRLAEKTKGFFDLSFNITGDELDNRKAISKNIFANHDRWVAAEIGVILELGQNKWKHVPDMEDIEVVPWDETLDMLEQSRKKINALEEQAEKQESQPKETVVITDGCPEQEISVFFEIGNAKLTHRGQLENLRKLVQAVNGENRKFVVTGYADSQTGNVRLNERLSAQRAETIRRELVEMGIKPSDIRTVAGGGTDTLNPVPANRRVVVTVER